MSDATKAVFLSYAREDTDAARRIAEALRGFGVEVWFDQNELRGGDQWDARIRGQIKTCALFVPVISATTQTREEAYFRLEWKLADDRSHLMAPGKPFVVPVVIDDTPEAGAVVPDSFSRSQWTRLEGGEPSTAFIEQVKRLLETPKKPALKPDLPRPPTLPPQFKQAARAKAEAAAAAQKKTAIPGWMWGVLVAVLVAVGAGIMILRKPKPVAPPSAPVVEAKLAPVAAPKLSDKSIAVLPFTNMSEDKDSGYFADGIHEDILTNLSNIRALRVVSRTSVMQYRATTKPLPQIARELSVAYVLEGSVRRAGNKVRVTGQLIRAATDEHLWAKNYDRDLTDIFAIQAELAQAIAEALRTELSPEEKNLLAQRPTENAAAYELVLKARELRDRPVLRGVAAWMEPARQLLERAVQLDPNYATAYADLASLCVFGVFVGNPEPEILKKARDAIEAATRLAPDSPDVNRARGDYYYYGEHDFARAMEQYDKVARVRPNDPSLLNRVASIQRRQARWTDSLATFRRLDDVDHGNLHNAQDLAVLYAAGRRFSEAVAELRRIVERTPGDFVAGFMLAYLPFVANGSTHEMDQFLARASPEQLNSEQGIWLRKIWALRHGDLEEAVRLDRGAAAGSAPAVDMAVALLVRGDGTAARARLGNLSAELRAKVEKYQADNYTWAELARVEAVLGHQEEALRCARQAIALMPESRDALQGVAHRGSLAFVYAWTGDKSAALAEYTRLLQTPFGTSGRFGQWSDGTVNVMKLDPAFAPLRGDPRFQALVNDPKNSTPLF